MLIRFLRARKGDATRMPCVLSIDRQTPNESMLDLTALIVLYVQLVTDGSMTTPRSFIRCQCTNSCLHAHLDLLDHSKDLYLSVYLNADGSMKYILEASCSSVACLDMLCRLQLSQLNCCDRAHSNTANTKAQPGSFQRSATGDLQGICAPQSKQESKKPDASL